MRYSTESKYRKYVRGYGFLSFATNVVINKEKKLIDTATKNKIRVVQKTAEAEFWLEIK